MEEGWFLQEQVEAGLRKETLVAHSENFAAATTKATKKEGLANLDGEHSRGT